MRIGHDNNYLSIDLISPADPYTACHFEVLAASPGRRFTASHERIMIETSPSVIGEFSRFSNFETHQMEVRLTEGGWLRLQRDAKGDIAVQYRIAGWKPAAALEGQVLVEGEFATSFCHDFAALLEP